MDNIKELLTNVYSKNSKYEIKLTVTDLETKKHSSVTMSSNLIEDVRKLKGTSLLDEMYNATVLEVEQLKKEIIENGQ